MDELYYSTKHIDGYQAIFNCILGARGVGKTFALKCKALRSKGTTMWVRRYENELDQCMKSFTRDLVLYGGYNADDLELSERILYYKGEEKVYFQALSLGDKVKSSSFPTVKLMVYDEFIIPHGRITYLQDEDRKLLDLYSTVFRDRSGTVFLLANNISFINPIFLSDGFNVVNFEGRFKIFGPRNPETGETMLDTDGRPYVVVEKYDNEAFVLHMKETKFGRFIDHIEYGRYSLHNRCLLDDDSFVIPMPEKARRLCNIRIGINILGMYQAHYKKSLIYYFDESNDPSQPTFAPRQGLKDGEKVLLRSEYPISAFRTWIGGLYFKTRKAKGIIDDVITTQYFK